MNNRLLSLSRQVLPLFIALIPFLCTAQNVLDCLPPVDSLTDWQVNDYAKQLAAKALEFTQALTQKSNAATANRNAVEATWMSVKADTTLPKAFVDSIAGLFKIAKTEEKKALREQNQAAKTLEFANKTVESDNLTQRKNLRKLWRETGQVNALVHPPVIVATPDKTETEPKEKKRNKKDQTTEDTKIETQPADTLVSPTVRRPPADGKPMAVKKKYNPAEDVMLNPPNLPCAMAVQTRDEFSGEIYKRTVAVELFRHTPAPLKTWLQGKSNVRCEAALASSGANAYLYLNFIINDPNPRKAFGKLDKNSLATLWFMDELPFFLYNQQSDEGVQNPDNQEFVFHAQYSIPAETLRKIRHLELDKIRIAWSSGYEDYDVQFVRLLMEQARCLYPPAP